MSIFSPLNWWLAREKKQLDDKDQSAHLDNQHPT